MTVHKLLATVLLAAGLHSGAGAAQGNVYLGETDYSTWNLFGDATHTQTLANNYLYHLVSLTATGVGGQGGAAFAPQATLLDFNQAFSFAFPFFIAEGTETRGDGLTFVLATSPGLGNAGSGLGYQGLPDNSLAFAVDTFNFQNELVSPSLQILAQGNTDIPIAYTETGLGDTIRDPNLQWIGSLAYTPSGDEKGTLTGTITRPDLGTFSVTAAGIDMSALGVAVFDNNNNVIGHQIFLGFTAANGLADDGQFVTSAIPVPEPHTYAMLLAGMIVMGAVVRRQSTVQR